MVLKKLFQLILILSVGFGFNRSLRADELITPNIRASYSKLSDGTKRIMISFSASENGKRVEIPDAELQITTRNDKETMVLGNVITNMQGKASYDISPETKLPTDPEGNYTFTILFNGNTRLAKATRSIQVTDAILEMSLRVHDTIKTITARVFKLNEKGTKVPVPDVPVEFDVQRLFCLYPVGNDKTDSTGSCSADFPSSMPGDKNGMVTLVIRTPDNETFGTVSQSRDIDWGKPLVYEAKPIRGLGDTDAPLWMVYTLLVLLSGVWLHVLYIIVLIVRIDRIGKKAINT